MNPALTMQEAVNAVAAKERRHKIDAREQASIIALLRTVPITQVKRDTGRSWATLLRIAEVMG